MAPKQELTIRKDSKAEEVRLRTRQEKPGREKRGTRLLLLIVQLTTASAPVLKVPHEVVSPFHTTYCQVLLKGDASRPTSQRPVLKVSAMWHLSTNVQVTWLTFPQSMGYFPLPIKLQKEVKIMTKKPAV